MEIVELVGALKPAEVLKIIERKPVLDDSVLPDVRKIVEAVRRRGDKAVVEYTAKFDGATLSPAAFEVKKEELEAACGLVDEAFLKAIREAVKNVKRFAEAGKSAAVRIDEAGILLEEWVTPLDRVGVYVPGGRFPLPSTVVMNVVPAKVAGVREIIMCTPPAADGKVNIGILAAAVETGVDRIFKIGGAQAVAAMAFGTATVPQVDKITGPGNIYVTMANREVIGQVGIDMLAGPSEVLIIADTGANPELVAQDMRAQTEHDPRAISILVTTDMYLAENVRDKNPAGNVKILWVETLDDAVSVADIVAPEHLEIMTVNAEEVARMVSNAGAVFVGPYTPAVIGDYIAGPNHTLPTNGTARFSSPLCVNDFVKRTSVVKYSEEALKNAADDVKELAAAEGLTEHVKAIDVRLSD